jgi:hypothetical protein
MSSAASPGGRLASGENRLLLQAPPWPVKAPVLCFYFSIFWCVSGGYFALYDSLQ